MLHAQNKNNKLRNIYLRFLLIHHSLESELSRLWVLTSSCVGARSVLLCRHIAWCTYFSLEKLSHGWDVFMLEKGCPFFSFSVMFGEAYLEVALCVPI